MMERSVASEEGGCLCGELRFRVAAPAIESGYCHCRMCQKNSGAPVVAWATFPGKSFSWIRGEPGSYRSSAHAQRFFCRACGSYVVFVNDNPAGTISVNTASFDDPNAFPPRVHIYEESRVPWFRTDDDLPKYSGTGPSPAAEA
jgi:hypothetical protein